MNVLNEIPSDQSSSGESLNPRTELVGGKIYSQLHAIGRYSLLLQPPKEWDCTEQRTGETENCTPQVK
jgi:hypothetical protein